MTEMNLDSWVDLFHKQGHDPSQITLLETIEVGYNSTVYLLSLDGTEYAVEGVISYQREGDDKFASPRFEANKIEEIE